MEKGISMACLPEWNLKPVISSIFVSKRSVKEERNIKAAHNWIRSGNAPLFPHFLPLFAFHPFFTLENHTLESNRSAFRSTTKLITLSAHAKVLFMVNVLFFIQLVSHRTNTQKIWHEMAPISLNCDANSTKSHHIYMLFNFENEIFLL